jgi:hypothetical protein
MGLALVALVIGGSSLLQARSAQPQTTGPVTGLDVPNTPVPNPPPVQPIPYSHKVHLALGLQCTGCHTNPEASGLMTFPATSICMKCHLTVAKNRPAIEKLASFDKSKTDVPWVRVYKVLPGVNWNHRAHLDAGMKCEMCHGDVSQVDANGMTNFKSVDAMGGCLSCHKLHNAPTNCSTCHSAWAPGMVVAKKPF